MTIRTAKFQIGQVVKHRIFPFRGIVFDVDPVFANSEQWYQAIPPDIRPHKDQPFYHLLAVNAEGAYIAYVSEQNLVSDVGPLTHPQIETFFVSYDNGRYQPKPRIAN